ncbi:MAG TPA: hypothetical protein VGJ37_18515, partial [Pyrinomonadaceae bacterium]
LRRPDRERVRRQFSRALNLAGVSQRIPWASNASSIPGELIVSFLSLSDYFRPSSERSGVENPAILSAGPRNTPLLLPL